MEFKIFEGARADEVLAAMDGGIKGVSVSVNNIDETRDEDERLNRINSANLLHVGHTGQPAYIGATVDRVYSLTDQPREKPRPAPTGGRRREYLAKARQARLDRLRADS